MFAKRILNGSSSSSAEAQYGDPGRINEQHYQGSFESPVCFAYGCLVRPPEIDSVAVPPSEQQQLRLAEPANRRHYATSDSALLTRQSNEHKFNQDRAFLITDFRTNQAAGDTEDGEESFLMGILDGHGNEGHIVAEHAMGLLPRILAEKLNNRPCCQPEDWIRQQLNETFLEVNARVPLEHARRGGCTASITLRLGSKLYFANVGDSRTILVHVPAVDADENNDNNHNNNPAIVEIPFQTRPDKANLPEERARIEAAGGNIHIPPKFPNGARVIVFSNFATPPEPVGLAMSRCLGDVEWKEVGVIAEPIVDVVDLGPFQNRKNPHGQLFVLAASDGVWDMRPKREFFARYFHEHLIKDGDSSSNREPFETVTDLIWDVSPRKKEWYRDDMTIIYKAIVQT